MNAARGGQIESIEGGSITCAGTLNPKQGYAVAVRQGVADAVTKIGTLKGVDITCTAIGQNYNTAGIHVDATGSGLCQIDTIDSCDISTQGDQYTHAGIQTAAKVT